MLQSTSPYQSPTDKVKVIQSPYVIESQESLNFPRMLMERIIRNKRKVSELSVEVIALKKSFTDAVQDSLSMNEEQQIVETIDISCD